MIALIRSGREPIQPPPPAPPVVEEGPVAGPTPAPQPQVVVIGHHEPVPVYVPVVTGRGHSHSRVNDGVDFRSSTYVPFQPAPPVIPVYRQQPAPAEPVYWGFGGKRRPDAWDEPQTQRNREDRRAPKK